MPQSRSRKGRGGPREATPGATYTNRTDLQQRQPVATAPGQTYGAATQQAQAQQAIPLPGAGASPATTLPSLGDGPAPGSLGALHGPTDRPGEPVTHGLPSGPGAGPEVLAAPNPLINAAAVLNNLGNAADPATKALRDKVNAMLANTGAA